MLQARRTSTGNNSQEAFDEFSTDEEAEIEQGL